MKIVINRCFGAFELSDIAKKMLNGLKQWDFTSVRMPDRNDPDLVTVVEHLGEQANTNRSKLEVFEIDDDCEYVISECDGSEFIEEKRINWDEP